MEKLTPHNISERESDWRGIKDGWYAVNAAGKLGRRLFANREDCLADINRQQSAIDA
jgi:hypothetical protein